MAEFDAFDVMSVTLGADLATNGTQAFTYPVKSPVRAAAAYKSGSGAVLVASQGFEGAFVQGASNFSLSYSSTTVTLTYLGATTIPAGTKLSLQSPLAAYSQDQTLVTENSAAIGGTQDHNVATLAMSVAWNGSSVYPSAADSALIIDGIREALNAANEAKTALNAINALLRAREIFPGQVGN